MKYQKGLSQIQKERIWQQRKELLFFLLGIVGFVILLASVGKVAG
jgi:hypothetical protein